MYSNIFIYVCKYTYVYKYTHTYIYPHVSTQLNSTVMGNRVCHDGARGGHSGPSFYTTQAARPHRTTGLRLNTAAAH